MKFMFAPEARPLPGYTIKRAIDRGGFGEVYYALSDSGKEVALKLLQRNTDVELRGIAECLNLKHPNLLSLFDVRTDEEGSHWLVMEYISGKSLELTLEGHPQGLPPAEVENWFTQMCAGVNYLHERGVVHRDLKPANIFREGPIVKIGDVGLAKSITPSRRSIQTESVGTVYYMAPEVAKGKYGSEIDVYSLGVMLFEMLTGRLPFSGESTGEILMKHLTEKPDLEKVPERFRPVVARALAKDPTKRTPSASVLAEEFRAAAGGKVVAQELTWDDMVAPPAPRRSAPPVAQPRKSNPLAETQASRRSGAASPMKPLVIAMCIMGVIFAMKSGAGSAGMFRLLVLGLVGVAVYKGWGVFGSAMRGANLVPVSAPRPPVIPQIPKAPRYRSEATSPATLRRLPLSSRMEDLTTSMTRAAFWTAIATVIVGLNTTLLGQIGDLTSDPARLAFYSITTLLGTWALLIPAKLWEGKEAQGPARRVILTAIGAAVGVGAAWLHEQLYLESMTMTANTFPGLLRTVGDRPLFGPDLQPSTAGFAVFFAALFGIRRWWWQADAFRSARFRFSSTILTALLGFVIPAAFVFPQNWAVLWAVSLSSIVQLSAGWVPVAERSEFLTKAA